LAVFYNFVNYVAFAD